MPSSEQTKTALIVDNIVKSTLPSFELPNISVSKYLADKISGHNLNQIAIIDAELGTQITYGELHQSAQHVASSLLKVGITKQDLILFYSENNFQYAISMLASVYLGVTFSPIAPANGPFEFTQQTLDAHGTVLMVSEEKLDGLFQVMDNADYSDCVKNLKLLVIMNTDQLPDKLVQHPAAPKKVITYRELVALTDHKPLSQIPYYPVEPKKDHYTIVYTSGTTGLPKGAIHTHYSFLGCLLNFKEKHDVTEWRISLWYPMGHISGTLFFPNNLQSRLTTVMHRDSQVEKVVTAIERYRVNIAFFSAAQSVHMANNDYHKQFDLSSLRYMIYGGSKIAANVVETIQKKYKVPTMEKYGATEFFGGVESTKMSPLGSVGTPLANIELKIVDIDTGKSLPPNERGEICLRGPPSFVGYLNNEQATKSTIDQEGWYHSSDIGYYDSNGELFVVDRIKELIKYKMWSIAPVEIEDFLHRHPAVASCCVVGVKHVSDGELIRAFIQLAEGKSVTEEELVKHVKDNMGFQKRLRGGVRFVQNMPRTVIGKVDRQHFKKLVKPELITNLVE